ncbi:MAG: TetR/AcrR family transcriptional regulator [Pseudomonadales bacterium]
MPSQAERPNNSAADGRRKRTEVTRRRILDSARELILEGNFDPTAEAIANHADITRRTLFRHFSDMATLHGAIILDAQEYARSVMEEPFPPALQPHPGTDARVAKSWHLLLDHVIDRRVRLYEYLLPLYISAVYQRFRTSTNNESRRKSVRRRRRRLQEILPASIASNTLLLESLDAILSIEYWITLREDQQLTVTKASKVLRYAVTQITHSAEG